MIFFPSFHFSPLDDFVIDTVVGSSELLSDVADSNVIAWGELKDLTASQDANTTDVHNAYIAAGILAFALLILAIVVSNPLKPLQAIERINNNLI